MNTKDLQQDQPDEESALEKKALALVQAMRTEIMWDEIDRKKKPEFFCPVTFNALKRQEFAQKVALAMLKASGAPANANKAAEEGELPALKLIQKLNGIAMNLAADLVQGSGYQFQGHDYLDRDYVCERVVQWRAEWDAISPEVNALSEKLRAADRASRHGTIPTWQERSVGPDALGL